MGLLISNGKMQYSIEELMKQNLHNKIVKYIGYFRLLAYEDCCEAGCYDKIYIEPGEIFVNAQFTLDNCETYTIKRDKCCRFFGAQIPKNEKLFTIQDFLVEEETKKEISTLQNYYK